MDDEKVIDLADLGKWLLKRWAVICATGAAGAALGGAVSYSRSVPVTEESLKAKLTSAEVNEVESVKQMRDAKQKQLDATVEYVADSAIMRMDAKNADEVSASYVITTDIPQVWEIYAGTALGDAEYQQIANTLKLESSVYASEMVSFDGCSADVLADVSMPSTSVMTVKTYGYTKAEAEAVQKIVSDRIPEVTQSMQDAGADVSLIPQGPVYTSGYDADLAEHQQKALTAVDNLRTDLQTYETSTVDALSADERAYLNALNGVLPSSGASAKPIAIGLILGLLAAVCAYCVEYLCAGVVRTADEAEQILGAITLGDVRRDADPYELSVPVQEINVLAEKAGGKVFIQRSEANGKITQQIKKMRSVSNAEYQTAAADAMIDADACRELLKSDCIIACVDIGHTTLKGLTALSRMTQIAGKKICGIVIVR